MKVTNINECKKTGTQHGWREPDVKAPKGKKFVLLIEINSIEDYITDKVDCNSREEIQEKKNIISMLDDIRAAIDTGMTA